MSQRNHFGAEAFAAPTGVFAAVPLEAEAEHRFRLLPEDRRPLRLETGVLATVLRYSAARAFVRVRR